MSIYLPSISLWILKPQSFLDHQNLSLQVTHCYRTYRFTMAKLQRLKTIRWPRLEAENTTQNSSGHFTVPGRGISLITQTQTSKLDSNGLCSDRQRLWKPRKWCLCPACVPLPNPSGCEGLGWVKNYPNIKPWNSKTLRVSDIESPQAASRFLNLANDRHWACTSVTLHQHPTSRRAPRRTSPCEFSIFLWSLS